MRRFDVWFHINTAGSMDVEAESEDEAKAIAKRHLQSRIAGFKELEALAVLSDVEKLSDFRIGDVFVTIEHVGEYDAEGRIIEKEVENEKAAVEDN